MSVCFFKTSHIALTSPLHTSISNKLCKLYNITLYFWVYPIHSIFGQALLEFSINTLSFNMLYRRASENHKLVIVSIKANGIHRYIKITEKGST